VPRIAPSIALTAEQALELEKRVRQDGASQRDALRARIILLAAAGWQNDHIADELKTMPTTVSHWRSRFAASGLAGLLDAPRSGRPMAEMRT